MIKKTKQNNNTKKQKQKNNNKKTKQNKKHFNISYRVQFIIPQIY